MIRLARLRDMGIALTAFAATAFAILATKCPFA